MKIITSISPIFERDLQRGMKHPDVKRLQQLLNLDSETQVAKTGDGSSGRETEVYGSRTEDAVRRFQVKHGIVSSGTPATTGYGRVGPKTRKAIIEAYEYKPVTGESKNNAKKSAGGLNFLWPLEKKFQRITQEFGVPWSANPKKLHTGIDIAVPAGEQVYATASGKVVKIGSFKKGWAQYIDVEHDGGNYCTAYLHVVPQMELGECVEAGEPIAKIAKIKGTHLHFNVWKGLHQNPLTQRGALPTIENVGEIWPKSDPVFPHNFVNPMTFTYKYV